MSSALFPYIGSVADSLCSLFLPKPDCVGKRVVLPEPYCDRCAMPYSAEVPGPFVCANCDEVRCYYDRARAAYLSLGAVREAIHQFKYQRAFWLRTFLGEWIREGYHRFYGEVAYDALVPVPLYPTRRRWREFNQAEILAESLSKEIKLPVWRCLVRERETSVQAKLERVERQDNMKGAFGLAKGYHLADTTLLMIDDVFTTGSTVNECASVLKRAGVKTIDILTVARG